LARPVASQLSRCRQSQWTLAVNAPLSVARSTPVLIADPISLHISRDIPKHTSNPSSVRKLRSKLFPPCASSNAHRAAENTYRASALPVRTCSAFVRATDVHNDCDCQLTRLPSLTRLPTLAAREPGDNTLSVDRRPLTAVPGGCRFRRTSSSIRNELSPTLTGVPRTDEVGAPWIGHGLLEACCGIARSLFNPKFQFH
jgi:hypothetical protein